MLQFISLYITDSMFSNYMKCPKNTIHKIFHDFPFCFLFYHQILHIWLKVSYKIPFFFTLELKELWDLIYNKYTLRDNYKTIVQLIWTCLHLWTRFSYSRDPAKAIFLANKFMEIKSSTVWKGGGEKVNSGETRQTPLRPQLINSDRWCW